jgi:phosphotransferase system  glucose/maltose/N-acetylglucosamine-specific IIC component
MNRNMAARVLWQSVISAIIAGIIYTVIFAITSKGFNGFIQGALVVAGITFVVAFLLNVIFSVAFMRKKT